VTRLRVGEDVDLDDPSACDWEAEHGGQPSTGRRDDARGAVDERRTCERIELSEGKREPRYVRGSPDQSRCFRASPLRCGTKPIDSRVRRLVTSASPRLSPRPHPNSARCWSASSRSTSPGPYRRPALFSTKTVVNNHLHPAYVKLRVSSRKEAADAPSLTWCARSDRTLCQLVMVSGSLIPAS